MSKYQGRTTQTLSFQGDLWPIVDQWAAQNAYKLVGTDQASRTYQRGVGAMVLPQMLLVSWNGQAFVIEAWVHANAFNRILTFGLMPKEVIVHGGGFFGTIPRKKAKQQVNLLLQALGEPLLP